MVLQIITADRDRDRGVADDNPMIQQCNGVEGPKDSNAAESILIGKLFIKKLAIWQINLAYKLCKCADAGGGSDRVGLGNQ